jgi:hypothetical protein
MKGLKLAYCGLFITSTLSAHYITYEFSGGRLGDNLIAYARAKYFAMRHKMELLYKEFAFSDQLHLHKIEKNPKTIPKSYRTIKVNAERDLYNASKQNNDIYVIPYFSEVGEERRLPWNKNWIHMDIDWNDETFKQTLRDCIKPIRDLKLLMLPEGYFCIAIHLRRGGGKFDGKMQSESSTTQAGSNFCDVNAALKFPPRQFYVQALRTLLPLIAQENVYVFLFTDDQDPTSLCAYFKDQFYGSAKHILFDARLHEKNNESSNVLEDFFSMLKFDALIRPESSYSIMAGHLSDYKYELYPVSQHWQDRISCVDKIGIVVNNA